LPWGFLAVVVAPTLLAAFYLLLIASPRYVSEAQFIVRQASSQQPSGLGMALQGVGLPVAQTDAFAVHEYMTSRDALRTVNAQDLVSRAMRRPGIDFLSARPRFWEDTSFDTLFKGFQDYLTVGYDSTTGISTIRVSAFTAQDALKLNQALLANSEFFVNRLNERAMGDSVEQSERSVAEAETRLANIQARLSAFRNREQFIDPESAAREFAELSATLGGTLATLRAERGQIAAQTPDSPQLPILDGRIRSYEAQLDAERARVAGTATSLAPKVGIFEAMTLEREIAARAVATANQSLDAARQDARRQHLYIEQVARPNLPERPTEPRRLFLLLTVLVATLVIYGLGWLVVAGVREHRQD
jgi:capsular polysaccharide transport system permease protein